MANSKEGLIFNDNVVHRNILSGLVRRARFQPQIYRPGVIFLEAADISDTGYIILDHQMLEMMGLDV